MDVLNPATGETIARGAELRAPRTSTAPSSAAKPALPEWLDATPEERSELLLKLADVIEENAEELAQIESRNVGKPLMRRARRDAVRGRQPALLRGRGAQPRGQVGGRVHQGLHVDDPARADRDRRRHLPVELPADDGGLEAGAGARGRQRADPQAVRADAALVAALRRARAGGDPGRRAPGRHRRRRAVGRADRRAPRRPSRLAHRRRRHREGDRAGTRPTR